MSKIYIYCLIDPQNGRIRYIGKSMRPKERLQNQMNEISNCHRSHWLQSLKRKGLRPIQRILEIVADGEIWQEREKHWIALGKKLGWPLTNNTEGGDGVEGLPPETREKMRRTWLGRKHKPETIEKLKIVRRLRKTSEETKAKMSRSRKGRKITWTAKIAEKNRKISKQDYEYIRTQIKKGNTVQSLADQYGVHRTTISKIKKGEYFIH